MAFYIVDKENQEIKMDLSYRSFVKGLTEYEYKLIKLKTLKGKSMCIYWKIGDIIPTIAYLK